MENIMTKSLFALIVFFVVMVVLGVTTRAQETLLEINPFYFALASFFFLFSVFLWIVSWAFLIKKHSDVSYKNIINIGFSSLYGSLTPIQLGAEALRSMKLKKYFNVSYPKSISSSVIAKGTKFLILIVVFLLVLSLFLLDARIEAVFFFGLLSSMLVIMVGILLFLLPLNKTLSRLVMRFLNFLGKDIRLFGFLANFFYHYSFYLRKLSVKTVLVVLLFALISFFMEFLALQSSFLSFGITLKLAPLLTLFIIVSILERVPLLPRGIGLVEFVGFTYLSIPHFIDSSLTLSEIGAVLIVFDFVRLVIPTALSLFIAFFFKLDMPLKGSQHPENL